jgi:hypothetical protein
MRLGRRYRDVMSVEWFWISWKLGIDKRLPSALLACDAYYKLENISIEFIVPKDNATSAQILVNGRFFHSELGTRADCPLRSRYRIQRGNAMSSARLTASSEAVVADRIMDRSALTNLQ